MNLPSPLAFVPVVLFCASSVLAQIERPIPYPIPQGAQWKNAVAGGTRTNDGSPGAKYWTNYTRYKIRAELIPEKAIIKGHIEMTYINRSPRTVTDLKVHLRQNLYKAGSLRNRKQQLTRHSNDNAID